VFLNNKALAFIKQKACPTSEPPTCKQTLTGKCRMFWGRDHQARLREIWPLGCHNGLTTLDLRNSCFHPGMFALTLVLVLALVLVPWRSHMWEAPTYPSHPSDSQSCTPCNQTLESSWQGSEGSTQQLGHSTADHSRCTSS